MANRIKALLMLLVFGLVLPAAGSPQRFCTRAMTFIEQDCCGQEKSCGDCPDDHSPEKPSCVSAAKALPDGINNDQLSLPAIFTLCLPAFILPEPVEIHLAPIVRAVPRDRAPPDGLPLFLTHRSLLI